MLNCTNRVSAKVTLLAIISILLSSCSNSNTQKLYQRLEPGQTGIQFQNSLQYNKKLNPYTYRNFYNGGGVGIGDFNNDGLSDIFFTGNQVSNKLYLNKGNLRFKDITKSAGLSSSNWSTGVSVADVNGDGWLDIYVCKSGSPEGKNRHNQLFINNGDLTFTEESEKYGLDVKGLSMDALFFDYDRDGDLDMYLLNNSFKSVAGLSPQKGLRTKRDPNGADMLFRNNMISKDRKDTTGKIFTEVTAQAGIYSSPIGFGMDALAGDVNADGWPDLYITNDFFERDYLYINNKDGTFTEVLPKTAEALSLSSMGGDIGDLNHDGRPEVFVTDMLPESWQRAKVKTDFYFWDDYSRRVQNGYHYQFVRNTLQWNRGFDPTKSQCKTCIKFSEIGRMAGVEATDWSWTALFADLDMDGNEDIFITNGIYKDMTDQDYVNNHTTIRRLRSIIEDEKPVDILFDDIPSMPISNYAYQGSDSLHFVNKSASWGLADPGFSNGAAYADLDNDGDLDLVINNVNQPADVYENRAEKMRPSHHSITITLKGEQKNTYAIGTKVEAWVDSTLYDKEQYPNRGFQSSVDPRINIGLGTAETVDSLLIIWPNGAQKKYSNIKADTNMVFQQTNADPHERDNESNPPKTIWQEVSGQVSLPYRHHEDDFVDFKRDKLLYHMHSKEGPAACVADINKDGLSDLYLGGAKGEAGDVFIQDKDKSFHNISSQIFEIDRTSEDTDCAWFDADGDGDQDLYVASGGSEFPESSSALGDRLYINDGNAFENESVRLPSSKYDVTSVVVAADFDDDGDIDLFTGSHFKPFAYGIPADGHLLLNDGAGNFEDATKNISPDLLHLGMITDAKWADIDRDGDLDLIIAGEWMPITVFQNQLQETGKISFKNITQNLGLANTSGWWHSIRIGDLDGDGYKDIMAGNEGLNNRFQDFLEDSLQLWINDFDQNGSIEQILTYKKGDQHIPLILKQDMEDQLPMLKNRIKSFKWYADHSLEEILKKSELKNSIKLGVSILRSTVFWNSQGKAFSPSPVPLKTQLAPLYGMSDVLSDSNKSQILVGGNLSGVKPQVGRYMSSYGDLLRFSSARKVSRIGSQKSGFFVQGEVRAILPVEMADGSYILVVRNDDTPLWFKRN